MLEISKVENTGSVVKDIYSLVNQVFKAFEEKLWDERYERVTVTKLEVYIEKGELYQGVYNGELASVVHLENLNDNQFRFGMLVTKDEFRGKGIANKMLKYVERLAKDQGGKKMLLEILKPIEGVHPEKEEIQAWYERYGYSLKEVQDFKDWYPHLDKIIKIPCALFILSKDL